MSLNRLRSWLDVCTSTHPACASINVSVPSRLVDVNEVYKNGIPGVRLVETVPGEKGTYACLSHCWGLTPIMCCTTRATLQDRLDFIEFDFLPRNFRDAIALARGIGLRLIWVDSLCIIQDDGADWEVESAKMAGIYRNAYLTIAATSSADSTGGCFSSTTPDLCFSIDRGDGSSYVVGARMCDKAARLSWNRTAVKERLPLLERGWVFQERLLSRRVLHCMYGELAFECLEGSTCECEGRSLPPHPPPKLMAQLVMALKPTHHQLMARASGSQNGPPNSTDASYQWRQMVVRYMTLSLTKNTDILPAISGCARIVQGWTGDDYCAGMRKRTLHYELLWCIQSKNALGRTECWTAPSWSWASIPPGQKLHFLDFGSTNPSSYVNFLQSSIRSVKIESDSRNDLGAVKSGRLEISARILPCFIRRYCHDMMGHISGRDSSARYRLHVPSSSLGRRAPGLEDTCCEADALATESRLDLRGGAMEFLNDEPPGDIFNFESLTQCKGCALARAWLMHAAHKESQGRCVDAFIVLAEERRVRGPGGFERAGMALFTGHGGADRRRWFDDVWEIEASPDTIVTIV